MRVKERLRLPKNIAEQFDDEMIGRLIQLREELHRHPELSFQEIQTSQRLYEALERLKPATLERISQTGIIARIKGKNTEPNTEPNTEQKKEKYKGGGLQ